MHAVFNVTIYNQKKQHNKLAADTALGFRR